MTKFSSDRFPPGFFDLPHDAGETLPLEIIEQWTRSAQTRTIARELLGPRTLRGTVVTSDSAGLTRLTQRRSLIEILAMIDRPKQLVHAYGAAIGGRSIGVWAADNTQMFYADAIAVERVVSVLLATLDHVARECEVGIGVAAHCGEFFELSGGLYGAEADRVESIAETHTEGGELVVTDVLADRLPSDHRLALRARQDLPAELGTAFRVADGPRPEQLVLRDFRYPAPYPEAFSSELKTYAQAGRARAMPQPAYEERAVVLIEREREDPDVPEVAVLNDLALCAAMKRIGGTLLRELAGTEIKTSGLIGLYTFSECQTAVDFARAFRQTLAEQGIASRIGVDVGQVLVFQLGPASRDIAGSPVNVASKLAQDCGRLGRIYLSEAVARQAGAEREAKDIAFEVSGVVLAAREI